MKKFDLSIVICAYQMERELKRTVLSCLAPFQVGLHDKSIEIIIANNDFDSRIELADLPVGVSEVINVTTRSISPVQVMNQAAKKAKSRNLLLILDGARMVSPNVVNNTIEILSRSSNFISTPIAFHLGPKHQSLSVLEGYNKEQEDLLLEEINWQSNGNSLFNISSLAGANPDGFYGSISESCAFGISKKMFLRLGGYESSFISAGGGFATLDLFKRAVEHKKTKLFVMVDSGSFHQLHGGVSTSPDAPHQLWHDEYESIRNNKYSIPQITPTYFGTPVEMFS